MKDRKLTLRLRRKKRIRKKVFGESDRPRLSVYRSQRHISAQIIDDVTSRTIVSLSSFAKGEKQSRANKEVCAELGKKLAEKAKEKNITQVVFDKNGFSFHGRVKALADGAREGGLKF